MDDLGRQYGRLYLSGRSDRINQLAHISLLDGKNNAYLGLYAGASRPLAGGNNTFVGSYSGANASSEAGVFVGLGSGRRATRIKETCFLGYKSGELAERVESSVCIGAFSGRKMTRANCNTLLGYQAGANLISGSRNVIIGTYAAANQFNAHDNVCIGYRSGYKNTIGANNCYIGTNSGFAAYNGVENTCIGVGSGEELYSGTKNVLCGFAAGSRIAAASNCIAIGTRAMQFFSEGDTNTCLGTQTGRYFSGNNNTILGGYSVGNGIGNFNSVIGSRSMNRRNGGRVDINRCVVVGENVVFDVPVQQKTLTYADATVSSLLTPDPNANVVSLGAVLYAVDTDPVGDVLLPNERMTKLTGVLATTGSGTYDISWSNEIDQVTSYSLLYTPYKVTVTTTGNIALYVDGSVVNSETFTPTDLLDFEIHQTSDPAALSVSYRTAVAGTYDSFSAPGDIVLPGTFTASAPDVLVSLNIATVEVTDAHGVPVGGQIYISGSVTEAFNGQWTIAGVPTPESFTIDITSEGLSDGSYPAGTEMKVYLTRPRPSSNVSVFEPPLSYTQFTATGNAMTVTGMAVTFNQRVDSEFVTNSILGPSSTDGHTYQGPAGSANAMNANIQYKQLEFANGGYSAARYTIGSRNTLLQTSGTFKLYPSANIDFGVEWLTSCKLSCKVHSNVFDIQAITLGNTSSTLAEISDVQVSTVNGNIVGNTIPLELDAILATDEQWVTVSLDESIASDTSQLQFTIRAMGGVEGWLQNQILPTVTEYVTVSLKDTISPDPNGASIQFYANAYTILRDISVYNERYRDTPVFANVIYLGSDHAIDEEIDRESVWITSLGASRVLRANISEFRIFPTVTHANAVSCNGVVVTETGPQFSMTVHGSYTIDQVPELIGGNALHVMGKAVFEESVEISNVLTANVDGFTISSANVTVTGAAVFQDAVELNGAVTGGNVIPISMIDGLQAVLDDFQARIEALEAA